jgi:hypothetical protein
MGALAGREKPGSSALDAATRTVSDGGRAGSPVAVEQISMTTAAWNLLREIISFSLIAKSVSSIEIRARNRGMPG